MASDSETLPLATKDDAPGRLRLLVISSGGMSVRPLPEAGTVSLGRGKGTDIALDDASISRRHALLHVARSSIQLEDAGSQNGSRVAGRKLAPLEKVEVVPGEAVELGSTLLVVQRDPEAGPSRAAQRRALSMVDVERLSERLAASTVSVLLLGETGVGKEVMADRLHRLSPRRDRPFVQLNCAAFTESLIEAELFGYERGAFTGADRAKPGLFEVADGGTLLLDEVAELPDKSQAKLLRVLEQREVLRLGATSPRPIDVRIIATTNKNLDEAMERGAFRRDLYFRLNGFELKLPPLRERVSEIASLAQGFIEARCKKDGRPAPALSSPALRELEQAPWPGNIRELRSVIDTALVLCLEGPILPEHLIGLRKTKAGSRPDMSLRTAVEAAERARILEACAGNQLQAARLLQVSRRTLSYRLAEYGLIKRPQSKSKGKKGA